MTSPMQINEMLFQMPAKGVEVFCLWADVNQRVLREIVTFSAGTAKAGVRLGAEMQYAAVEAARDGPTSLLLRHAALSDAAREPAGGYQRSVIEWTDGTHKAFKVCEGAAQALTRSTERMRTMAEQTGKEIQAGLTQFGDQVSASPMPVASPPRPREQRVQA